MKNDKQLAVLLTNHNYFIRTVIAEMAKLILVGVLVWIAIMICAIFAEMSSGALAWSAYGISQTTNNGIEMFCAFLMIVLIVGYIAFLIVSVMKILKLHKTVTRVENKVLGDESTSVKE